MDQIDPFRQENSELAKEHDPEGQSEALASSSAAHSPHDVSSGVQAPVRLRDDPSKRRDIQIVDAIKTSEGSSATYIAYAIRSDGEARRRYSEFEALRIILGKLYPVLIVPPIPPHHSIGDYAVKQGKAKEDANVIARRRRMLAHFLNRCNCHPLLGIDRTFQRFLDPKITWAEIAHSAPVTLLPKNSLKAPSHDPTNTALSQLYNSLPNPTSGQPLQEPDQRFRDSEEFTAKFSAHLSSSTEKINRRLMKRWADMSADYAELGGLFNGFGLTEPQQALSTAIERTGAAVDNTYVHTNAMLQEWERSFTEPLAEYSQFSAIIKGLLKFRHGKHLQFEVARDVLESKRESLIDLERTESEARRLEQALERSSSKRTKALDSDSPLPDTITDESPMTESSSMSAAVSRPMSTATSGGGFLGALQHTINGLIDNDPEATRRNSIGKTRESIAQLEEAIKLTAADLRYSSQTIQADLDRFQRQKVGDIKDMCLAFAHSHEVWAKANSEQWKIAKAEVERIGT